MGGSLKRGEAGSGLLLTRQRYLVRSHKRKGLGWMLLGYRDRCLRVPSMSVIGRGVLFVA